MMIFWRIRYFDRNEKQFKNRDLFLDTAQLPLDQKAIVELAIACKTTKTEQEFLKFRPLFQEGSWQNQRPEASAFGTTFFIHDYFEDEAGNEISMTEIARIKTGDANVVAVPPGAQQHDLDLMMSKPEPMPLAEVKLAADHEKLLGYFARDLRELLESALIKEGPGSIESGGQPGWTLKSAVSDEEIRSFVTIFRRLYMTNEPANFLKAVAVFEKAVGAHPYGKWVSGTAKSYEARLDSVAGDHPIVRQRKCSFNRKRLIDVFLYTRYAHQPDEKRQSQYLDCLNQIGNDKSLLAWLFLTEIWETSLQIINAGRQIAAWFLRYCEHHGIKPDVLPSVLHDSPGIGSQEKEVDRHERLLKEKATELAKSLWTQRGEPAGGYPQFLQKALAILKR